MAGYQPQRPRPTDPGLQTGLPGDPVSEFPEAAEPAHAGPAVEEIADDPPAGPSRRALPRPAPPMDRRLPGLAIAVGCAGLAVLMLWWRRLRRS